MKWTRPFLQTLFDALPMPLVIILVDADDPYQSSLVFANTAAIGPRHSQSSRSRGRCESAPLPHHLQPPADGDVGTGVCFRWGWLARKYRAQSGKRASASALGLADGAELDVMLEALERLVTPEGLPVVAQAIDVLEQGGHLLE